MDLSSSYEENSKENGFQITKAVLITIIVAVAYIILVVSLMLYCRYKRQKNRGSEDAEKECDDTRSDEKEVRIICSSWCSNEVEKLVFVQS